MTITDEILHRMTSEAVSASGLADAKTDEQIREAKRKAHAFAQDALRDAHDDDDAYHRQAEDLHEIVEAECRRIETAFDLASMKT